MFIYLYIDILLYIYIYVWLYITNNINTLWATKDSLWDYTTMQYSAIYIYIYIYAQICRHESRLLCTTMVLDCTTSNSVSA
jgi:hypothetical protein